MSSNVENILRNMIDGTAEYDPPRSRVEEALVELKESLDAGNGGGTVDEVARNRINTHADNSTVHVSEAEKTAWNEKVERSDFTAHTDNSEIHVTADEKTVWNAKADLSDIPTSLPANGGNAETLDGLHANEIASNPNLLINPDFKINQRGQSEYNVAGYTVDRWLINPVDVNAKLTVSKIDSGISLSSETGYFGNWIIQMLEEITFEKDTIVTLSVCAKGDFGITYFGSNMPSYHSDDFTVKTLTYTIPAGKRFGSNKQYCPLIGPGPDGTYAEILWAKLELGSVATPFTPPDPATELLKCQRYYLRWEKAQKAGIAFANGTTNANGFIPLPVQMRTTPTISFENMTLTNDTRPVTDMSVSVMSTNGLEVIFTGSNFEAGGIYMIRPSSNGFLTLSAEL